MLEGPSEAGHECMRKCHRRETNTRVTYRVSKCSLQILINGIDIHSTEHFFSNYIECTQCKKITINKYFFLNLATVKQAVLSFIIQE
jgi:hypothetical protein